MTDQEKELCREMIKLLDDICDAHHITLFPEDKATRDELEIISW